MVIIQYNFHKIAPDAMVSVMDYLKSLNLPDDIVAIPEGVTWAEYPIEELEKLLKTLTDYIAMRKEIEAAGAATLEDDLK